MLTRYVKSVALSPSLSLHHPSQIMDGNRLTETLFRCDDYQWVFYIKLWTKLMHMVNVMQTTRTSEVIQIRLVVIFQEAARNHFWEAGMLMQSYMLNIVQ